MKYMGSKNRISKYILPLMLKDKQKDQFWVEPFVGGGNIIDKVIGPRIGNDNNKNTIDALISIRDHLDELPKNNLEFTENDYKNLKNSNFKHKGYASFAFSYGAKYMGGWRRSKDNNRDYVNEAYKNAKQQSIKLQNVILLNKNYFDLEIPNNSFIYCDPPYKNTTSYKNNFFDYDYFYEWCKKCKDQGHTIFISEYEMPNDFKCIWEMEICSSLTKNTGSKKGIEKLYTI